jgi:hypothetical protein
VRRRYVVLGGSVFLALAIAVPALGGPSNPVAHSAATLKQVKKTANTALNTANAANAAAGAAQNTANQAKSAAAAADTKASNAQTSADAAKAAADAAQATANTANGKADTALATKFDTVDQVAGTTSALNSADKLAPLPANCPNSDNAAGGGYQTAGAGANEVTPTINIPYGLSWFVFMSEIGGGTANTWSVQAFSTCMLP